MKNLILRIDQFLLPKIGKSRLLSYVWLLYLSIFFMSMANSNADNYDYLISAMGTLAFLFLYFHAFWVSPSRLIINVVGILLIGTLLSRITPGASVFFVFAGAFCFRFGSVNKALIILAFIVIWIILISWIFSFSVFFYAPALLFSMLIGGVNIFQSEIGKKQIELEMSQQEIKALARTAERERIARDLHDLIGHTFSIITLKAELAGKLIKMDTDKAHKEIKELETISRDALTQIREVVTGYRTADLIAELAHAKYVLESNDIHFEYDLEDILMDDHTNKELAIILKELVTNVLKHSHADKVSAKIYQQQSNIQLEFLDNGKGLDESNAAGYGLQGIRERVTNLAGSLNMLSERGLSFSIQIPLDVIL